MKTKISKTTISYIFITALISVGFICLAVFVFRRSYVRLYESCYDLGNSFWYYILRMGGKNPSFTPSVTTIPDNFYNFRWLIPQNSGYFGTKMGFWWSEIWRSSNLGRYTRSFFTSFSIVLDVLTICVLLCVVIWYFFRRSYMTTSSKTGVYRFKNSKGLETFYRFRDNVYRPCKDYCLGYIDFLRDHSWIWKCWILLWCLNFNFLVIGIEFFSYYFYFVSSFDFVNLYIQFYKLFGDLTVIVRFIPAVIWVIAILLFIRYRRVKRGYDSLDHLENKNKGFVASLGVSSLLCGEMGKGKTKTMTDMALSLTQYYRHVALDKLMDQECKFTDFNFTEFGETLKQLISKHLIYSLATARAWIRGYRHAFDYCFHCFMMAESTEDSLYFKQYCDLYCFGYNWFDNDLYYNNGLKITDLFSCLETYAQLFFIYFVNSSLIFSNYAIVEKNDYLENGYFGYWNEDFFHRKPTLRAKADQISHILDFNMMRLGRTFLGNDSYKDALEFGVICISESGKERLNQVQTRDMKIDTDATNQLNDNFNLFVKLYRHSATVDGFCFGKILMDEQRVMSVNADLREVCECVIGVDAEPKSTTVDDYPDFMTLPFGKLEMRLYESYRCWYKRYLMNYSIHRGDRTFINYLFRLFNNSLVHHFERIKNTFGVDIMHLTVNNGSLSLDPEKHDYYLCRKKIYSSVYDTAVFNDVFNEKALSSAYGIADVPNYSGVKATSEELGWQRSYLMTDISRLRCYYDDDAESGQGN